MKKLPFKPNVKAKIQDFWIRYGKMTKRVALQANRAQKRSILPETKSTLQAIQRNINAAEQRHETQD